MAESALRLSIIREETLRRELASDEAWRERSPAVWRHWEAARREENRAAAITNERLTALGLQPVPPRPSLAQKRQELQRLTRRNEAMTAALEATRAELLGKKRGTALAGRRSRRRG
jgi:hypothetical protein